MKKSFLFVFIFAFAILLNFSACESQKAEKNEINSSASLNLKQNEFDEKIALKEKEIEQKEEILKGEEERLNNLKQELDNRNEQINNAKDELNEQIKKLEEEKIGHNAGATITNVHTFPLPISFSLRLQTATNGMAVTTK